MEKKNENLHIIHWFLCDLDGFAMVSYLFIWDNLMRILSLVI